jgi:hypothetical protein
MESTGTSTRSEEGGGEVCDRRLSRGARAILKRHLLQALLLDPDGNNNNNNNNNNQKHAGTEDETVWSLLDRLLPSHDNNSSISESRSRQAAEKCLLLPSRDIYRQDEQNVKVVKAQLNNLALAYPTTTIKARRKTLSGGGGGSGQRPTSWYQCGYCGKTFATRFYMDLHMDTYHPPPPLVPPGNHLDLHSSPPFWICPATRFCRAMGGGCHDMALTLEPYYDRGSGGWGEDGRFIQHKLTKKAHADEPPCTSRSIQQAKKDCRVLMENCGLDSSGSMFCDSLACPNRLQQVLAQYGSGGGGRGAEHNYLYWIDQWQDEWSLAHNHSIGVVGILLLIGLLLWYAWYAVAGSTCWDWWSSQPVSSLSSARHNNNPQGRRLLQKSKAKPPRKMPWTTTTTTLPKKKQH